MKAIIHDRYGPPEVLRLGDLELPEVGDDDVLIRVRAASLNAGDWRRVRASPFVVRFSEGLRKPRRPVFGTDVAGHVEAVGSNVTDLKPGDEVYGIGKGAFAEFVLGSTLVPKPVNMTFEQAAAVPVAGLTALQGLRHKADLEPGRSVLINGAGGGVGTFFVQVAKAIGAEVTAVTRTEHLELVRSLGADHVLDYTRQDYVAAERRYDLIVDVGGNRSMTASMRALTSEGKLLLVGAGKRVGGPVGRFLGASVRNRVLRQPVVAYVSWESSDDLHTLKEYMEAAKLSPVIDRIYPLDRTAEALRYLESEAAGGKIVITV